MLWQCFITLLGSMEHTRMAAVGICHCQSQHTMAIPRPPAPPFLSIENVDKIGKLAVLRQGEATIVVLVLQIIAREHGTHHKGSRWHLPMPITTNCGHAQSSCPLFSFLEGFDKIG